jgi:threonine/homoserine/homoserine lactone efflux protein
VADLTHPATAFGLGMALAAAPGPVQVLLLGEAARGGLRRGLAAMAGANGTFGALLLVLAAGLSVHRPGDAVLRGLRIAGGTVLMWIAIQSLIESLHPRTEDAPRPKRAPTVRGVLSVLINPAAWIFLATTASALLAAAGGSGGRAYAFVTAAAMLAGVMIVDGSTVALGAGGRRYLTRRATVALGIILSAAMAAIAGWLLFQGATG